MIFTNLRTITGSISLLTLLPVVASAQSPKIDTKGIGTKKAITTVKSISRKTEATIGKDARKIGKVASKDAKAVGKTVSKDSRKVENAADKMLGIKK